MVYLCADVVHTYVVVIFCLRVRTCKVNFFFLKSVLFNTEFKYKIGYTYE